VTEKRNPTNYTEKSKGKDSNVDENFFFGFEVEKEKAGPAHRTKTLPKV
jgi:hypothetical protein